MVNTRGSVVVLVRLVGLVGLVVLGSSCTKHPAVDEGPRPTPSAPTEKSAAPPTSEPTPSGTSVRAAPTGSGGSQEAPVTLSSALGKVCSSATCTGPLGSVLVWRTASGEVGVLEHRGDIRRCSHPPTQFFDAHGTLLGVIPNQPVTPGSAEDLKFRGVRDEHTRGLVQAESLRCDRAP